MEIRAHKSTYFFLLAAALIFFAPANQEMRYSLGANAEYRNISFPTGKRKLHVIRVPRTAFPTALELSIASGAYGRSRTVYFDDIIEEHSDKDILAAINGAYLQSNPAYAGRLRGPIVDQGQLYEVSTLGGRWPSFRYRADGTLSMDYIELTARVVLLGDMDFSIEFNSIPTPDNLSLWMEIADTADAAKHCSGLYSLIGSGPNGDAMMLPQEQVVSSYLRSFEEGLPEKGSWAICAGQNIDQKIRQQLALDKPVSVEITISSTRQHAFGSCSAPPDTQDKLSDGIVLGTGSPLFFKNTKGETIFSISSWPNIAVDSAHPRTAVCWNANDFYLIAAEGTKTNFAELAKQAVLNTARRGFTPSEVAEIASKVFSCECAILLDGGGSTGMFYSTAVDNIKDIFNSGTYAAKPGDTINSALLVTRAQNGIK